MVVKPDYITSFWLPEILAGPKGITRIKDGIHGLLPRLKGHGTSEAN